MSIKLLPIPVEHQSLPRLSGGTAFDFTVPSSLQQRTSIKILPIPAQHQGTAFEFTVVQKPNQGTIR